MGINLYLIRKNKAGIVGAGTAIALSAGALFLMGGSPKEDVAPALATVPEISADTITPPNSPIQEQSLRGDAGVVQVLEPEAKAETPPIVETKSKSTTTLSMRLAAAGKTPIEQGRTDKWNAKIWESVHGLLNPLPKRFDGIDRKSYRLVVDLKEWCDAESKRMDDETDYETYSHFCADEFNTVGGLFTSMGYVELDDNDNKNKFGQYRTNQQFRNKLFEYSDLDEGSEGRQDGHQQLKHMCQRLLREKLSTPVNSEILNYAKQWCGKMPGSSFSSKSR